MPTAGCAHPGPLAGSSSQPLSEAPSVVFSKPGEAVEPADELDRARRGGRPRPCLAPAILLKGLLVPQSQLTAGTALPGQRACYLAARRRHALAQHTWTFRTGAVQAAPCPCSAPCGRSAPARRRSPVPERDSVELGVSFRRLGGGLDHGRPLSSCENRRTGTPRLAVVPRRHEAGDRGSCRPESSTGWRLGSTTNRPSRSRRGKTWSPATTPTVASPTTSASSPRTSGYGPLTAPASTASAGNGLYGYGSLTVFPDQTARAQRSSLGGPGLLHDGAAPNASEGRRC